MEINIPVSIFVTNWEWMSQSVFVSRKRNDTQQGWMESRVDCFQLVRFSLFSHEFSDEGGSLQVTTGDAATHWNGRWEEKMRMKMWEDERVEETEMRIGRKTLSWLKRADSVQAVADRQAQLLLAVSQCSFNEIHNSEPTAEVVTSSIPNSGSSTKIVEATRRKRRQQVSRGRRRE